jgi:hypothetical protein
MKQHTLSVDLASTNGVEVGVTTTVASRRMTRCLKFFENESRETHGKLSKSIQETAAIWSESVFVMPHAPRAGSNQVPSTTTHLNRISPVYV